MVDDKAPGTRGESSASAPMTVFEMIEGLPYEGEAGRGLLFRTNRGEITSIIHRAPSSELAVIWVVAPGAVSAARPVGCTPGWPNDF